MYDVMKRNGLSMVRPNNGGEWLDHMFSPLSGMSPFAKTENGYVAEFDVPGFGEGDIEITVEKRMLSINGKKGKREVHYVISVPKDSTIDDGVAKIKDGVLRITLPISESSKPKQIEVRGE